MLLKFFVTIVLFYVVIGASIPNVNTRIEETDEDQLCNNLNLTVKFSNLQLNLLTDHFLSSPLIHCLDLSRNGVTEVQIEAFSSLPHLKYLDMSDNQLSYNLDKVLNLDFPELETLILNSCDNNIYDIVLSKIHPKLRKLFLNNNGIRSMYTFTGNVFPALTHLYLANNRISNDNFDWLPETLEYLDITGHMLQSLTLRNLKNLRTLLIDQSEQKSLQNIKFHNLMSLEYLSLPSNSISEISSYTFINTTSLQYLDLSDNDIRYIEDGSFDSMEKLEVLNLSNNYIELIQASVFDKLTNLKKLVLEKNLITVFPTINDEIKIESISLNCNQLKNIKGGTFAKLPFLESLYLHDNEIIMIDQEAFEGLINLKTLTLSNNKLSVMQDNWMTSLISLEHLDLVGNNFKDLDNLALLQSSPLRNLYLSRQLQYIGAQSLLNVPENVTIDLSENEFIEKCDKNNDKYSHNYRHYG